MSATAAAEGKEQIFCASPDQHHQKLPLGRRKNSRAFVATENNNFGTLSHCIGFTFLFTVISSWIGHKGNLLWRWLLEVTRERKILQKVGKWEWLGRRKSESDWGERLFKEGNNRTAPCTNQVQQQWLWKEEIEWVHMFNHLIGWVVIFLPILLNRRNRNILHKLSSSEQ